MIQAEVEVFKDLSSKHSMSFRILLVANYVLTYCFLTSKQETTHTSICDVRQQLHKVNTKYIFGYMRKGRG